MSRDAKDFARIYGSRERCAFVADLPCIICARLPCQNAHVRNGGMGRKADSTLIVPLCELHHAEYDNKINGGRRAFFDAHQVTQEWMEDMAALTERQWREFQEPGSSYATPES